MNQSRPHFLFATSAAFGQVAPALVAIDEVLFYRLREENATGAAACPHCFFRDPLCLPPAQAKNLAALLRELASRPDDFGRELAAGARIALSATAMESVAAIGAALERGTTAADDGQVQTASRAWELWLTLLLAQGQDRTQEELVRGLALLREKEKRMLARLHGRDETDDITAAALPPPVSAATRAAWSALFAVDPEPSSLLLTDDSQAVAILAAVCREMTGRAPDLLLTLDLPEITATAALAACRRATENLRRELAAFLAAPSGAVPPAFGRRWRETLEQKAAAPLPRHLDLFRFEGVTAPALLLQAFGNTAPPATLGDLSGDFFHLFFSR